MANVKSFCIEASGIRLNIAPDDGRRLDVHVVMSPRQMLHVAEEMTRAARRRLSAGEGMDDKPTGLI
jgi:hypothetical protein